MRELLAQLAKTKDAIESNAQQIERLQREIVRLHDAGKDVSAIRAKLGELHALHLKVLAVQTQLQKTLNNIGSD